MYKKVERKILVLQVLAATILAREICFDENEIRKMLGHSIDENLSSNSSNKYAEIDQICFKKFPEPSCDQKNFLIYEPDRHLPWIALLESRTMTSGRHQSCSAAIIHENFALTSKECTREKDIYRDTPKDRRLYYGAQQKVNLDYPDGNLHYRLIEKIIPHKVHEVALLQVDPPITEVLPIFEQDWQVEPISDPLECTRVCGWVWGNCCGDQKISCLNFFRTLRNNRTRMLESRVEDKCKRICERRQNGCQCGGDWKLNFNRKPDKFGNVYVSDLVWHPNDDGGYNRVSDRVQWNGEPGAPVFQYKNHKEILLGIHISQKDGDPRDHPGISVPISLISKWIRKNIQKFEQKQFATNE